MEIRGLFENRGFVRAMLIMAVVTAALLISNIFVIGGDQFFNISNTLSAPVAALSASLLFYLASTNRKDSLSRVLWSRMALGFGLWGVADVIWAFYALVLNDTVPYPSFADILWVIGYIPLYLALMVRLRSLKVVPSLRQQILIIVLNLALVALTGVFILTPILQDFDLSRLYECIFNLVYPLADIGLLILASLILILLKEGRFALVWRLIFSGILVMTLSDLLFAYGTWHDLYYPDGRVNLLTNLADTTYTLAYLCSALGILIYHYVWEIKETLEISTETMPALKYYAFLSTNRDHQVIAFSDNLHFLLQAPADSNYYKQPLESVLGIPPEAVRALVERIAHQTTIRNEPLTITTRQKTEQPVSLTAMATFNPGLEFLGVNFALSADIAVPEALRLPRSAEIRGMLNYLLSAAGSRSQDETQAMQVYFTEVIRLHSSILYQFGGAQFRAALFERLNQTIQRERLPIEVSEPLIRFPEVQEGNELAAMLLPLLRTAMDFTRGLIEEQIINDDLRELEKPLNDTVRGDLDRYQLRAFHSA